MIHKLSIMYRIYYVYDVIYRVSHEGITILNFENSIICEVKYNFE